MAVSLSLLAGAGWQFFDDNGNPLSGGLLYTYEAGTATPLATYTDSNGNVANANPIVLDAAGRVPYQVWLTSGATYKLILKTSLGITVWTEDDVPAEVDFAALAASSGSSLIGFLQSGTGAVARTVQSKLRERISLEDFGAVGDDSTNDTAAIQAAINYAQSAAGYNRIVEVEVSKEYRYTALTISGDRVMLVGTGRLTKTTTTGDGITIKGTGPRIYGCGIDGPTLGQVGTATSGRLLYVENVGQAYINLKIKPAPGTAYQGVELYNCSQIMHGPGFEIQLCSNIGYKASDSIDLYYSTGRSDANGSHGWMFDTCSGVYAGKLTAYNNNGSGVRILNTIPTPILADGNSFHFWESCIADTNGSHNWHIAALKNSTFIGCWGASQNNTTTNLHGMFIDGCDTIDINGPICISNNGSGIRVVGGTNKTVIRGGRANGNGKQSGSSLRYGISLDASSEVSLDSVEMTDPQVVKTQLYGLHAAATLLFLSVDNCDMRGNATGPYSFGAVPSTFKESNNSTGESPNVASASITNISYFGNAFSVTGTTDIYDIRPRWTGRSIELMFDSTARVIDKAGGSAFALPVASIQPGQYGAASFTFNGTYWICQSYSVNDGV